jgi:hypothetical protein
MSASTSAVTPERILQLGWAYAPPLAIEAAVRHRVFDVLDAGPLTLAQTVAATGTSERGLRAVMNLLVGLGLLTRTEDGCYALSPESSAFLVSSKPAFHGGLFRHMSSQLIPSWMCLSDIVATGKPAVSVNQEGAGGEFFSNFVMDIFPLSYQPALALAHHLAFGDTGDPVSVLDIAAGSAVWSIALAQSSPRVVVTAVDWPEVLPTTQRSVTRFGLAERYTFAPGDLSQADFGRGHAVATLGHILHSEGAQRSQQLLRRTFDALAPGGTIAISEFLVNPERTGPTPSLIFAVNMLVNTDQGDTFTYDEIAGWLKRVGFVNPRTLNVPGPSPLILATRPESYN